MTDIFDRFETALVEAGPAALRAGQFGRGARIEGPSGPRPLIYADDTASGRALRQVETLLHEEVLPFYANSHTEASHCGALMTRLRRAARARVARGCGVDADHAVIFCGNGATAGINRLVALLGVPQARASGRPIHVLIGPWEHHSNILPWRESGADVTELPEGPHGPCLDALEAALARARRAGALSIAAISGASNVTGAITDTARVTRIVKHGGGLMVWDMACAAPYLPLSMRHDGADADAMVLSPHKFAGGPGASGVLVVRRAACIPDRPSQPGGGTVRFVSPDAHDYLPDLAAREEAGTPDLLGDIRAALAFGVKAAMERMGLLATEAALARRGLDALRAAPGVELLGDPARPRLPIFALRFTASDGTMLHQQLATRLLSDQYGVQARGGCACAGPYVHRLLGIDAAASEALRARILSGEELAKPGFVRFNLSPMMEEAEIDAVLNALAALPDDALRHRDRYAADPGRAIFGMRAA
ncbi:aminotransferase class V-fold PLP-dependent enzyme [Limimaricola cinnabarinus]|uniref:Aminotransferase n=1 Tax=Limimaricola cinnabarinus TaxID=1125964 RepID=A0A2G1MH40_9RHOB|nr:aminotransferase class V-fold PLP-dependent enzyme [Limimaricola cinnabarinus]PHP28073.1 aminotransferase [Limimaricola cinnabarinus]